MAKRGFSFLIGMAVAAAFLAGCGSKTAEVAEVADALPTDAATSALMAQAIPVSFQSDPDTVTTSGSATTFLAPDKAEVNVGVSTLEADAAEAQQKNTETVNAVLDAIRSLGVEDTSIRTTNYSVYQEYDYSTDKLKGYNVTTTLSVKDLGIEQAGEVITEAIRAGANTSNGIRFTCSEYDQAYEEALGNAVEAARAKAEALAQASGKQLGEVKAVTEGSQNLYSRYTSSNISYDMPTAEAAEYDMAAIMPGESEIQAMVTVTFYLQ